MSTDEQIQRQAESSVIQHIAETLKKPVDQVTLGRTQLRHKRGQGYELEITNGTYRGTYALTNNMIVTSAPSFDGRRRA